MKEISKFYPLEPEAKANLITREELFKSVRGKVAIKFPDELKSLDQKAKAEAEKRFVKAKLNDYVGVTYEKGGKSFTLEGYFFGFGVMEHSVNIGGNVVAIFDLSDEDRVKFDDKFREFKKEQFITGKIQDFWKRKAEYSVKLLRETEESIIRENEEAGYILAGGKWMSPKELTANLVKSMASEGQVATTKPVQITDIMDPLSVLPSENGDKKLPQGSLAAQIAEVKKAAEKEQMRIKAKYAGIDADQGYELAIWGMKHNNVNLLFQVLANKKPEGNIEGLTFSSGALDKVELHFFHGYFHKAVVTFRIAPIQAMELLARRIEELYGKTDQQKEREKAEEDPETVKKKMEEEKKMEEAKKKMEEAKKKMEEAEKKGKGEEIEEAKKKMEEAKKEVETTTPVEPEIPLELTLTWTGEITKGTLFLKLNQDKTEYSTFILTKENPKIVEDVTAVVEKERKQKAEEDLKKKMDEYKSFDK
jgi:hypothetical protein